MNSAATCEDNILTIYLGQRPNNITLQNNNPISAKVYINVDTSNQDVRAHGTPLRDILKHYVNNYDRNLPIDLYFNHQYSEYKNYILFGNLLARDKKDRYALLDIMFGNIKDLVYLDTSGTTIRSIQRI